MRTKVTNAIALAASLSYAGMPYAGNAAQLLDPPCDTRSDAFYVGFALRTAELEFKYGAGDEEAKDFGGQLTRAAAKMLNAMPERDALTRLSDRAMADNGTRDELAQETARIRAAIYEAMSAEHRAWIDFGGEVGATAQACWLRDEESWDLKRAGSFASDRLAGLAAMRDQLVEMEIGAQALAKLDQVIAFRKKTLDNAELDNLFDSVNELYKAALRDA